MDSSTPGQVLNGFLAPTVSMGLDGSNDSTLVAASPTNATIEATGSEPNCGEARWTTFEYGVVILMEID